MENNICNSMILTSRRRHFYLVGQSKHKVGACGVNNQASAILAGNELPFVAFSPDGHGYELVSSVRALVPQKFSVEEELKHVKHVEVKSPNVGAMWKFGRGVISSGSLQQRKTGPYHLRPRNRNTTEAGFRSSGGEMQVEEGPVRCRGERFKKPSPYNQSRHYMLQFKHQGHQKPDQDPRNVRSSCPGQSRESRHKIARRQMEGQRVGGPYHWKFLLGMSRTGESISQVVLSLRPSNKSRFLLGFGSDGDLPQFHTNPLGESLRPALSYFTAKPLKKKK
ncbi:hypothetical protein TNCV_3187771 [Trichonephila clavipes]|nr:hypothetical protein TNCV_3187771 [Trichonephila clavipes]